MHKSNGGYEFWNSIRDDVINKYVAECRSSNSIAKDYGCDGTTILSHLKRWNVPIRKERYNSIYAVNTHFFDVIDTEEKAYILGLLLSDGHISKRNVIMLTLKDKDIIEKYLSALNCNTKIRVDRYGNFAANITSKKLADRLREIGFHNRKSYEIDIDRIVGYIPQDLEHHFVRGLFDGDGSIRIYRYDYLKNPQLHFGFTGLHNVVEYVKRYLNINTKTAKESEITYTCVSSCRKTICDIYKVLYRDATIYIDRKHNTFIEIIDNKEPSTTIMGGAS